MSFTKLVHNKMEISDFKPTSKPSSNKVRIVSIEEVEFCTAFVGGVSGKNICGLMKGDNGSCNKYKTHADQEKGNVESALYLTPNCTKMFLKPLVKFIIRDENYAFLFHVGEDLSKDTAMYIVYVVTRTANASMEGVDETAYVGTILTAGMEVIENMNGEDPGNPSKRLKTFVPKCIENISDPVIANFISKLQLHLNHSAEVIVGAQASISLLNRKIGDVPEDHTVIWCAIGDITKKLISHGSVLENLDLDFLIKEDKEAHLLTVNIKTSVDDAMAEAMSAASKVGYISATITQLVTTGSGGCLDSMHHNLNMGEC